MASIKPKKSVSDTDSKIANFLQPSMKPISKREQEMLEAEIIETVKTYINEKYPDLFVIYNHIDKVKQHGYPNMIIVDRFIDACTEYTGLCLWLKAKGQGEASSLKQENCYYKFAGHGYFTQVTDIALFAKQMIDTAYKS